MAGAQGKSNSQAKRVKAFLTQSARARFRNASVGKACAYSDATRACARARQADMWQETRARSYEAAWMASRPARRDATAVQNGRRRQKRNVTHEASMLCQARTDKLSSFACYDITVEV